MRSSSPSSPCLLSDFVVAIASSERWCPLRRPPMNSCDQLARHGLPIAGPHVAQCVHRAARIGDIPPTEQRKSRAGCSITCTIPVGSMTLTRSGAGGVGVGLHLRKIGTYWRERQRIPTPPLLALRPISPLTGGFTQGKNCDWGWWTHHVTVKKWSYFGDEIRHRPGGPREIRDDDER